MNRAGFLKDHGALIVVATYLCDWLAIAVGAMLASWLYLGDWPLRSNYYLALLLGLFASAWLFSLFDLYRAWRGLTLLSELRAVFLAWTGVFLVLALMAVLTKTGAQYSRGWGVYWYGLGFMFLLMTRLSARALLRILREKGYNLRNIVVVGTPDTVATVSATLEDSASAGFRVLRTYVSDTEDARQLGMQRVEIFEQLVDFLDTHGVDQVWIALPLRFEEVVVKLLHDLRFSTVDVRYVPDLRGMHLINHSVSTVAGLSLLDLSTSPLSGNNVLIKSIEDRLIATLVLVIGSPLLIVIAIAVKLSSDGPVFYRQERVGWNGNPFMMLKFRTMQVDAEKEGVRWGGARDKRTTRLGAFLRRTSLDELPQFFNVLQGDMSIVGPRPERPVFVEQFKHEIPGYMKKHLVKAGITGWAQVNGWRGDTDLAKRIEFDMYYIDNFSLAFDLKIILRTLVNGLFSDSAY
jgi:putative colanic acid biosynthesis UDP-glucose lipid carrier transferase